MSTYGATLFYRSQPVIAKDALLKALRARSPSAQPLGEGDDEAILAFMYPDHMIKYEDGEMPAQVVIKAMPRMPNAETIEEALQQTWEFDDADKVVAECTASVIVSDMLASRLPHRQRFYLFYNAVLAVHDIAPADAIYWHASEQVIDPQRLVAAAAQGDLPVFGAAGLNVRFFEIEDGDAETLMDTVGLAPFGFPDLQCHFRDLNPLQVGSYLHSLGLYIYENGDTFEDGETIDGFKPGLVSRFQHEKAMADPEREVIDLDPGDPHAGGERNRKEAI